MSLETYTRLLIDANPEFPIHFLNIYTLAKQTVWDHVRAHLEPFYRG